MRGEPGDARVKGEMEIFSCWLLLADLARVFNCWVTSFSGVVVDLRMAEAAGGESRVVDLNSRLLEGEDGVAASTFAAAPFSDCRACTREKT